MVEYCEVCNTELEEWEDGICDNCKASIIYTENIYPDIEDFA